MSAVVSQIQGEPALVEVRRQGGVATLAMNRGAQFNALSSAMIAALQTQLDTLAADRDVRVVVLAGVSDLQVRVGDKDKGGRQYQLGQEVVECFGHGRFGHGHPPLGSARAWLADEAL